ncbi:MAG TPA: formate--tetrahydrofolate ligase [Gaiellaceae bacterium]|nr:formate--tetrahydrofolate ligase [Gaiellaceae bacterium]
MASILQPVTDLEIARRTEPRPIGEVAADLGLGEDEFEPYGRDKAKVALSAIERRRDVSPGKLVAVTAITPTPFGEGKTTTAIGLVDGLVRSGRNAVVCLREPSMGPVFGIKGGGAGGGRSQVVPMEDINLHFTGDIHAVGSATNLLAAMLDAHLFHGNALGIDPETITWRRALDVNDRALRRIVTGLGPTGGVARATGFDITAASETMGILAAARDLADLRERLGRITVARTVKGEPVTADALGAAGSMAVLLREALKPNLIQTLEGVPAIVHAGPFANIAHGNNSLVADLLGLRTADYVVTEGGFGSEMGFEKQMHLVSRRAGFQPNAVVLVVTLRALRHHGDGDLAVGGANLLRHIGIVRGFGIDPVVAVNRFPEDTDADVGFVRELALEHGAFAAEATSAYSDGGSGAVALAEAVAAAAERTVQLEFTYELDDPIALKIEKLATRLYGAAGIELSPEAEQTIAACEAEGLDALPICMAKTPLSLSHDPALLNAPEGFTLPVREIRPYTGAGWLVVLCGDLMTMPGLSAEPAALRIDIDEQGRTVGLR